MRKIVIGFGILVPIFYAAGHSYNFEYYKTKTIELLPVLDIDPSALSFIEIKQNPTIEERQKNPNVVFINVEKLNELFSHREAMFECIIEAQLSRIPSDDWKHIMRVDPEPRRSIAQMVYVLWIPLICYCCRGLSQKFSPTQEMPFTIFTMVTTVASGILFANTLQETWPDFVVVQENFERKKFFIQLNTVSALFKGRCYTPIAVYGAAAAQWQYEKMNTYGMISYTHPEVIEAFENMSTAFTRWAETYPNLLQKIVDTAESTQELFV